MSEEVVPVGGRHNRAHGKTHPGSRGKGHRHQAPPAEGGSHRELPILRDPQTGEQLIGVFVPFPERPSRRPNLRAVQAPMHTGQRLRRRATLLLGLGLLLIAAGWLIGRWG